jgi:sugar lactone lactonase YvrE
VQSPKLSGIDGIALDARGGIFAAMSVAGAANTIARVRPDLTIEDIASAADGLDYTASPAFGTRDGDRRTLYFTNAGLNFGTPSLMSIAVGVPGKPLLEDGN